MRDARSISPANADEAYVHGFDLVELCAENPQSIRRLQYLARFTYIIGAIQRYTAPGGSVLEIGCAQGNISLQLAERGFQVVAADLNPHYLAYSRKKHEHGQVEWLAGNAFELPGKRSFDTVILAEILEHVAHPAELVRRALQLVRPGGHLLITTPNHNFVREKAPSFTEAGGDMLDLERRQFGPGGEHHLFTLTMHELANLIPASQPIVERRYVGSVLYTRLLQTLWNSGLLRYPLQGVAALLPLVPGVGRMQSPTISLIVRRQAAFGASME